MSLRILKVSKTYSNGVLALDNISLNIPKGIYGLLGSNGAGKSSLMRSIASLQDPDSGQIFFNDLNILKNKMKFRQILGYLPQEFGVYPKVSTEDLLNYFACLKGIYGKKDRKKVVQFLLELTNLIDVRKRDVFTFSRGMKQRFGIAQALLGKPRLIIFDEPTSGMDPEERLQFYNTIVQVGKTVTIILSTHIVDDVHQLCSKFSIMEGGKILIEISTHQALKNLKGKIWVKTIEKNQNKQTIKEEFPILCERYKQGSKEIRVFSNSPLKGIYKEASPHLEDFYLSLKKRLISVSQ